MTQRFLIRFPADLFEDDWMESAFRDMDHLCANFNPQFPPTDILVNKKNGDITYRLAIAGYDVSKISITTEDNSILIEGSSEQYDTEEYEVSYKGIRGSNFRQRIPISTKYDLSKIEPSFKDGILTLNVPLSEERKPKKLTIKTS